MTDRTDTTTIVAQVATSDYFPSPLTEHHPRDHHPTHHGPRRNHHLNRHHHHQISPHGYRQGKCGSHRPCESTLEDTTSRTPHDHNHADRPTDDMNLGCLLSVSGPSHALCLVPLQASPAELVSHSTMCSAVFKLQLLGLAPSALATLARSVAFNAAGSANAYLSGYCPPCKSHTAWRPWEK